MHLIKARGDTQNVCIWIIETREREIREHVQTVYTSAIHLQSNTSLYVHDTNRYTRHLQERIMHARVNATCHIERGRVTMVIYTWTTDVGEKALSWITINFGQIDRSSRNGLAILSYHHLNSFGSRLDYG